jgi:hypothetical protein
VEESFLLEDAVGVGRITETKSLLFATLKQNDRFRLARFPELRDESVSVLLEEGHRDFQAFLADGEEAVARVSGHGAQISKLYQKRTKIKIFDKNPKPFHWLSTNLFF